MTREEEAGSAKLRLFVAVQLPASLRERLHDVQTQLRRSLHAAAIAWTREENLHLTLRFLGAVPFSHAEEVKRQLRGALENFGVLKLTCRELGCFPDTRHPRVLWAGISDAAQRLPELRRRVDEAVRGFAAKPAEARFVGHVTLARLKQCTRSDAEKLAQFVRGAGGQALGEWPCGEVELVASELAAGGSRYTTLAVFPL